ncbi:MAG: hypothetical protein A2Z20_07410 [Bdellovibrionales bacterium RBG_16_40_8]|nr:MAG: hypothetical protein A2Z20_07410 [Bdellovibrionales bacterium RBG_16_40_8]
MRHTIYILLITLALVSAGCGSKKGGSGGGKAGNNGGIPPYTDPTDGTTPSTGGVLVDMFLTNKVALDQYLGWTTNDPKNFKVNVNIQKFATYSKTGGGYDYGFGGYVSIKFSDGTSNFTDTFSSMWQGGTNVVKSNTENHKYNLLSSDYPELGGTVGYHGFFEDTRVQRMVPPLYGQPIFGGAVILVIDSTNDLGDGSGPTSGNGSVWFKNYIGQYPMGPLPSTNCWFISSGPYDCRSWKSGNGVNTKKSIYPDNGYVKLGTFVGLDMKKAFNDEI